MDESASEPQTDRTKAALTGTQRRVGWTMLTFVIIAIAIGLVMAAIVFRTWTFFFIVLLVVVPYALLLTAPAWLARVNRRAPKTKDQ
jgi:Flp pilus assembly protein TadB